MLRLAFLQGTAGNRAVTQLLGRRLRSVQRQTPPPAPEAGVDPPGPRLKSAAATVKAGTLDDRIWQLWKPTGTKRDAILEQLWVDDLALPDIDPKTVDTKLRKTAKQVEADLGTRITTVLAKQLAAMDKELTTPDANARVGTLVEEVAGQGKGWSGQGLVDVAVAEMGRPRRDRWSRRRETGRLEPVRAPQGRRRSEADRHQGRPGFRMTTFSDTANAALDKKEVAAVKDAAGARIGYVVGNDALADLTDDVMGRLGTPKPRTSPEWTALNGRMRRLLIVAETDLANTIPHDKKVDLWPERWAEMRDRYVNTTTKTIWRYWKEDVVDFTFLGIPFKTSTANMGLHRDVAEVIKRVETSAIRLSGLKDAKAVREDTGTKSSKQNSLPGSEFRFEAVAQHPWMLGSAHLSYHGTGRALDFRAARTRRSRATRTPSSGSSAGRSFRATSRSASMPGRGPPSSRGCPRIARSWNRSSPPRPSPTRPRRKRASTRSTSAAEKASETDVEATSLRDHATTAWERVTNVEAAFQSAWSTLKGETKTNDELGGQAPRAGRRRDPERPDRDRRPGQRGVAAEGRVAGTPRSDSDAESHARRHDEGRQGRPRRHAGAGGEGEHVRADGHAALARPGVRGERVALGCQLRRLLGRDALRLHGAGERRAGAVTGTSVIVTVRDAADTLTRSGFAPIRMRLVEGGGLVG